MATPTALLLFAGVAAFCLAPGGVLGAERKVAGQTEEVRGAAVGRFASEGRPLRPPEDVYVGETVSTAEQSRAQFKLGRDTTLRLGADTNVRIDRFLIDKGGVIAIGQGAVLLDKTPGTGDRPVELKGAFGLIVVRGTRLFAGPSNGVIGVFVEHGEIDVASGGRTARLHDGEGVDIAHPGAPPTAPKRWGGKRIEAALRSVD